MAAVESATGVAGTRLDDEGSADTSKDPRSASSSNLSDTSTSSRHPDLSEEVAALSDKLIKAINQQTTLDDTLAHTRHELAESRSRIEQLEAQTKAHDEDLSSGRLLTRRDADSEKSKLIADLADVQKQKSAVQQEKRGIEAELETLTASLFEEANKMVATANKERDATERKNQQLKDQIKDTEMLLASQHEQLTELKGLMQSMSNDRTRDLVESPLASTAPTSPTVGREDSNIARLLEAMNLSPASSEDGPISPAPSTNFTYLIKAVCRNDVPAYDDFRNMILNSQKSQPASRIGSGSYSGLNVMGLSSLSNANMPSKNGSSSSLSTVPNLNSSQNLPGSFSPTAEAKGPIPLKETKFFKRLLVEDIEPTLRLDLSPSISWLSRRSIISALVEGAMVVEPIPESHRKLYGKYTSCAMCGDARKQDENPRTHRMRVNEGEGATKWPLCVICLEKVRGVGDLINYTRMIRDGVVRLGDQNEELEAWDELIKLRERLFWARMAGGVVPAFLQPEPSSTKSSVPPRLVRTESEAERQIEELQREAGVPHSTLAAVSRHDSGSSSSTQGEVDRQLELEQNQSAAPTRPRSSPPTQRRPQTPPPPKRESGGFLKVNIPGSFWNNHVNVLH